MIELMGFEAAIEAIYDDDERLKRLLEVLLLFQKRYCGEIAAGGLGVTVFESWATPPLVSPEIYKKFAFPYERALLEHLEQLGVASRPLVIGGDTRAIVDDILDTGTTLLVSDYNTPLPFYAAKARAKNVLIRANIDPRLVRDGSETKLLARVKEILHIAEEYPKLIVGTGVIPYDTPPENLLRVKRMLEDMN
jgi:uroporphyrinogen decarboxylase